MILKLEGSLPRGSHTPVPRVPYRGGKGKLRAVALRLHVGHRAAGDLRPSAGPKSLEPSCPGQRCWEGPGKDERLEGRLDSVLPQLDLGHPRVRRHGWVQVRPACPGTMWQKWSGHPPVGKEGLHCPLWPRVPTAGASWSNPVDVPH